jgi:hypothetical protein
VGAGGKDLLQLKRTGVTQYSDQHRNSNPYFNPYPSQHRYPPPRIIELLSITKTHHTTLQVLPNCCQPPPPSQMHSKTRLL